MSKTTKLLIILPILIISFFLGITDMVALNQGFKNVFIILFFISAFVFIYMALKKVPYKQCSTDTCKVEYQHPDQLETKNNLK